MDEANDKVTSRVCHMCWVNKPIIEFVNRAQTRYCKICKTCRSGQLLRYYEKKKSPTMTKKILNELNSQSTKGLSMEPVSSQVSSPHFNVKTEHTGITSTSVKVEEKKETSDLTDIPFLQARCRIIDARNAFCRCTAKLLFHESYSGCESFMPSICE